MTRTKSIVSVDIKSGCVAIDSSIHIASLRISGFRRYSLIYAGINDHLRDSRAHPVEGRCWFVVNEIYRDAVERKLEIANARNHVVVNAYSEIISRLEGVRFDDD
jgi:hypothetical protein